MHTPLVLGENGEKLSKQNGATALDTNQPLVALNTAAQSLGLPKSDGVATLEQALALWIQAWLLVPR
jgi:glutamyl-Q tRNA(Asp) synthetase